MLNEKMKKPANVEQEKMNVEHRTPNIEC